MKKMRNAMNKWGFSILAALLLLCLVFGASADGATGVPLSDYADLSCMLTADVNGTALPQYVENGQSLFFQLAFDLKEQDSRYLLRTAYQNGEIGPETTFTVDISSLNLLDNTSYPTSYDAEDNIASDNGVNIFRWWVDKASGKICLRFFENVLIDEGNVSNTKVAFDGMLNVQNKPDDGRIMFRVENEEFPLMMKAGYELNKAAGVPYFSTDASSYLVDYTVTLALDQHMKLSSNADNQMYCAALTLVDSVEANGALTGEIYGDAVVTAPEGETASAAIANSGIANTLTLSSPDQILKKGDYTIKYTMKLNSEAALAKLSGYTDAQKTNTVELKENGDSLKTPLTAAAMISWDKVTEKQFKIDKNAFTDHTEEYGGAYLNEAEQKLYVDFRVTVYIKEPFSTFTVEDTANYALTFRDPDVAPVTLEGVDTSENFWTNNPASAALTYVDAIVTNTVENGKNTITLTAPEGEMLPAGAYQLRVPADITSAMSSAQAKNYPQYYSNTARLVKVDDYKPTEEKEWKYLVPTHDAPRKDGGYVVDDNGDLLFYNGKPVIRWDVYFGWNFYDKTTFTDTLTGMELLVNDDYPFEIHSFDNMNKHKERLASFISLSDTSFIDFNDAGTGFTFNSENMDLNSDGTYVKLYKMVYFTTPADDASSDTGYVTTDSDIKNSYILEHKDPFGNGFDHGPIEGEVSPTLTAESRLSVTKAHVIERTDSLTQWKITCKNDKKIPFERFSNLDIVDLVPRNQTPIGEVTIHYSDKWPVKVEMVCDNNQKVTLVEGTHYQILRQHPAHDFGENGKYGFAVDLNIEAVAAVLAEKNATYFKNIDVTCYLNNETHKPGQNYRIKNEGWLNYTNLDVDLVENVSAHYDRGFATRRKEAPLYGDYYDPTAFRNYTVCTVNGNSAQAFTGGYDDNPDNGDGNEEILWKIFIGAREFENDPNPIKVTVTDTISDSQMFPEYKGKSLKDLFLIEANKNKGYIITPDSVSISGNTFTLTFTVPGGRWAGGKEWSSSDVYIYYHTVLKPEAIGEALDAASRKGESTFWMDYSNTASVGWNGESNTMPTSSGSTSFGVSMLDKSGKFIQSAGNKVEYTIDMNLLRADLQINSDVVQLEDQMGAGKDVFVYLENSFRLINMDNAKVLLRSGVVSESTYVLTMAEDGKSFTLDVPDEMRLRLTYQVRTIQPVGTKDVSLLNTASLAGRTGTPSSISFTVNSSYQSGSFEVAADEAAVRILKISSEDAEAEHPTGLDGAVFSVTELNADGTDKGDAVTMTTNSKGIIELRRDKLSTEAVYFLIEETKAPVGYMIGEKPWKGCYAFVPADASVPDAVLNALKDSTGCAYVLVIPAGCYKDEWVENEPVSLTIHKVDENGNTLPGATFVLKDSSGNTISPEPVTFVGKLRFTGLKAGDYTLEETVAPDGYELSEENLWNLTIGNDGKVTIAADAGYQMLSVSDDGFTVEVVNEPEKTTGSLAISKTVSSTFADHATKEFEFTVTLSDTSITGDFGDISFENGVATVLLKHDETKTALDLPAGVSYTVVETEVAGFTTEKTGDTGAIVKGETVTATFTNTYEAKPTTASFPVKKELNVLQGMTGPEKWSYTIDVVANDGAPEATTMTGTVSNETDTVTFGDFTYTAPGEYTYTVTETGTVAGVTNDSAASKTVTVTVVDNGDGTLTATADSTANEPLTFTNTYSVGKATASFPVKKVLTVSDGVAGPEEWSYTIDVVANNGAPEATTMTGTVSNETDTVTFGDFTYTSPGEYTYTVTETGTVAGVTNDSEATTGKTVTVTVVDNGDGTLTATADSTVDKPLTFTNTYSVGKATASFPVKKVLEVPAGLTAGDIAGKFTFTLTAEDGVPMPAVTEHSNPDADGGVVTFGEIEYAAPGEYTYTVTETGTVAGVTNDTTASKTVTVTVVDNGDGTLTATADSTVDKPLTFTNTYSVGKATVSFSVKKELEVPAGLTAGDITGKFTFTLTAENGVPVPAVTEYSNPDADGGVVTFGAIEYTAPGEYTYTVTETGTVAGVTNDTTASKTVTVTVEDNGDGTLTATADSTANEPLTFTNTYSVGETTASFPVKKELNVPQGMTGPKKWSYTINVVANDGAPEATTMTGTVSNEADTVTFGDFTYTAPGEYTYTVTETGSVTGVTNDTAASKTVTVTVVDNGDGTLTATADSTANEPLTFTNTYRVESTTLSFPVEKVLEVSDGLTAGDITSKFTFTLTAGDGVPMPDVTEYSNPDADGGVVTFGAIEYTAPGEYTYTVTETGTVEGVTNDSEATTGKTVTVTVVDNGDGTLTATADSTEDKPLTFTNTYSVGEATASFPVEKVLEVPAGLTAGDITGKFTFTLTAENGVPMPDVTEYSNPDADGGVVTFGAIEYTAPGEYTYTVTETGTVAGVTNDTAASKTVTVTVVDNGDGTLTATADSTTNKPLTFTNTYSVGKATASFPVEKVLEVPAGLTAGDITGKFTFTLTAEDGVPMPAVTEYSNPDADGGVVTFGAIEYTTPGTYKYTVTETGTVAGVTNDQDTSKTVTVTVVDNGDGTLTATADSTANEPLTFTNTYSVGKATVSFPVKKVLTVPEGVAGPEKWSYKINVVANDGAPEATTMTGTVSNENDTVTFGDFTYTAPGEYTYTVTETGTVAGVTNDSEATTGKTVTVTVVDNGDGTLTAAADSTANKPLTFTNTYSVGKATVSFPVEKVLEVPDGLTAGDITGKFTFTLTAENGVPMPAVTEYSNPDADGGVVTFGAIEYTTPGTYKYTVTETGTVAGVTNDQDTSKTVTVTVVDNGDGTLTATADSTSNKPLTFTNTYSVGKATVSFPVKKVLTVPDGVTGPEEWSYTIDVVANNGAPEAATMTGTVSNEADTVTFGDFTYTAPGEYTYTVTETGTVAGVTNDSEATTGKNVTVTVVDNGDGTLTATADSTANEPLTFTNTYSVGETTASFPVKKELNVPQGMTGPEKWSYTIDVVANDGAPEATTMTGTVSNEADTVTFGDFTYTAPGEYTYTVTETGTVAGVTNDSKATTGKTVTVTVVDNGDGTLTATADSTANEPLTFTNTYSVGEATVSFPVEKVLEVPDGLTAGDITGKFTFTLTAGDGVPMPDVTEYSNPDADGGVVTFGAIEYTAPGEYTYTVTETGTVAGVTNDSEATTGKTVTVTVVDNGDGTLTATADSTANEPLTFTNTYSVGKATASFPVEKVLEVPAGLTAGDITGKFTFTLTAEDGVPMPAVTEYSNPDADGGVVTFGEIEYTAPGTYQYTVTESGSADGVTNDAAASKTVTVTVVDNGDGTLTATADSNANKPLTFTNTYSVGKATASFPVEKVLEVPDGLTAGDITGKFTFTLTAGDGVPMPAVTEYNNPDADGGVVTFGEIEYTAPGTYQYTVTESGTVVGVTNDAAASKTVTVTVVDNGDGTLTAAADSTANEPLTFTNTYSVGKATASFPVEKVLEVSDGLSAGDITGKFTFTLTAEDGVPMPAVTEYSNPDADGGVMTFGAIEYTAPGTYQYTVTESGTVAGVTNDAAASKTVTVTVVDNGDGTLTAAADSTANEPLTFTNTYRVESTTLSFPVEKVLEVPDGLTAGDITGKFTFTLTAEDGVPMPAVTEYSNPDADGGVMTFGAIEYTAPGTYQYTVTESGTVAGVTNDAAASKTVTVTVVDNGDGTLTATADSTANEPLTFTNTYDAEPVELALQVEKDITGRDLVAGEFSFTLQEQSGTKTLTAQNAADGTVVFPAIEYAAVGEYVYTITETKGTLGGVAYDTHTVTATVTVTDTGKGALEAKVAYSGETTFSNIYTASGDLRLTATKTVNGVEPREDEVFSFELCDAIGNVLQTKQNIKGSISFDAITYTEADIGKSFLYQVQEKQETRAGYTFDKTVYAVAVWVADNGDGTLKVTKAITSDGKAKEAITFANTYAADGKWTPTAAKTVNGAEPREDQVYEFTLTDAAGNTILAENEKGEITFNTLTYDLNDVGNTYTYTVQEITTSTDLLAVDESIYTVDVTVTDNKDGTLAVQPVITKNGEPAQAISFANTLYAPLTISKTVEGCETAETFPFTVKLYNADGTEATGEYAYTGDVEGKLKSGDDIELAHDQSVTISGLLPGMTYTVTEAATAAFETTVNGNTGNSIEGTLAENANEVSFVNKFKTTMFMVKKSWQGGGGGAIELTLYANGEKLVPQPVYTREDNTYLYTDLPMYDEQEQLIVYSAKEKYVDGFLTIYSNVAPYADETRAIYDGGTIINKAIVKADFSVKKEWSGLAEGETAPEIMLVLYCNGVATDIKTPKPDRNGWYKYYDLPGEVDGVKAVYTVKELAVDGYVTSYKLADGTSAEYADNGGTITNAKIPQTGDETPLALWLTLMGASAAMLMLLQKRRKA